ncbi:MAG: hypothetical protein F6K24_35000 [Okeania sp. SIO2D1]|nr:hypothetical protein [Okeania sp. SIO2D1]
MKIHSKNSDRLTLLLDNSNDIENTLKKQRSPHNSNEIGNTLKKKRSPHTTIGQ